MKKYINYSFALITVALLLSSCQDKVDIKVPNGETLLVVDGWITNMPGPYTITLSTTGPYFENNQTPRVQSAIVVIKDSEGIVDTLTETAPGVYKTNIIEGKIGNGYVLNIYNALGENYIANTKMERGSVIDSLKYEYLDKKGTEEDGYYIRYYGPEPAGVGDYYRFLLTVNDKLLNQPGDVWQITSDELVDGNYISAWDPYGKALKKGEKFKIQGLSLTQDAYYFFNEMATQVNNGGLFANPPANVRTNIINTNPNSKKKAVGYFGASSVSEKEVVIE